MTKWVPEAVPGDAGPGLSHVASGVVSAAETIVGASLFVGVVDLAG